MHATKLQDLEDAMLRRFQARFECDLSADELADFAERDENYEAEMDRLFAEQLAADGIAAIPAPQASGNGGSPH